MRPTGGNFQQKHAKADITTAILVADACADPRAALVALRSEVLQQSIANDPPSSTPAFTKGLVRYLRP